MNPRGRLSNGAAIGPQGYKLKEHGAHVMTVQELMSELQAVEDKSIPVRFYPWGSDHAVDLTTAGVEDDFTRNPPDVAFFVKEWWQT